ncbi:bifunctional DNA-binding transcriptional regulator/O6-methylguanine-DNA methyltransferase Ada [Enterovibrio coralii]|uniref:methylated-DNA--[protein]-cysteine S-methyltransferase n=1 Tax=Enterovibrio coralii TaxID=294935 RepID=A0A135IA41_9GAMM|nr:bifunctional DNA-binding transcriptional regulator/O6-methylguanine-DNA methyltransferase Ada [Enterovibrio coralii]KXF82325.1 cysteine methyltransferase [Enterovibrio coralii]
MTTLTKLEMETAVANRDNRYDRRFIYGVITTGVFCHPSCTSKSANPDNMRFFADAQHAIQAGFRPCKRCYTDTQDTRTRQLIDVVRYIEAHCEDKLTLQTLADMADLSPSRFQKVFKSTFGISPKAYQDAFRMRRFKQSLKTGNSVTDAIYDSGFGSISRVYGEESRKMGMNPKTYKAGGEGETIYFTCRETKLGLLLMAATDIGVCCVQFGDDEASLVTLLEQEFPKAQLAASDAQTSHELDDWITALDSHISQGAPKPDLPLDLRGTVFQIKVWQFLLSIKDGEVCSYGDVANEIGSPKAVRAVGTACGKNRIGVLVPCHRVLRNDGSLGGYRWGLERKKALLEQEKQAV